MTPHNERTLRMHLEHIADLRCQPIVLPRLDASEGLSWRIIKGEFLDPRGQGDPYPHDLAVATEACRFGQQWGIDVSFNIHPGCLEREEFADDLIAAVEPSGINRGCIIPELIETSEIKPDLDSSRRTLRRLCGAGFSLGVDDMGDPAGHVATPEQVRVLLRSGRLSWWLMSRILKLDRSLLDPDRYETLRAFIDLAAGRQLICEGVETQDQLRRLVSIVPPGTLYQGYLFSRPVPPAEFEKLLDAQKAFGALTVA
jgi:EAL domain-containing protein (putative c-di-GMP-specific phosphodiesterase class I)